MSKDFLCHMMEIDRIYSAECDVAFALLRFWYVVGANANCALAFALLYCVFDGDCYDTLLEAPPSLIQYSPRIGTCERRLLTILACSAHNTVRWRSFTIQLLFSGDF